MGEIIRMLKDHKVPNTLINKFEELPVLMRLINAKIIHKSDLSALNYQGFVQLFIQIALFVYSKPPHDLSNMPPVESWKALLTHFEKATKVRGDITVLNENPDVTCLGDPDLLRELNKRVQENASYPIPEGYRKVCEKDIVYNYSLPIISKFQKKQQSAQKSWTTSLTKNWESTSQNQ
jgi:hypothetical protein